VVELLGSTVVKRYTGPDAVQKIQHLKTIYASLEEKQVPNTDSLVYAEDDTVLLQPRGDCEKPRKEKELLEALVCILNGLIVSTIFTAESILH
jgi:hypothetical protein